MLLDGQLTIVSWLTVDGTARFHGGTAYIVMADQNTNRWKWLQNGTMERVFMCH